jgi:GTPase SAR1 family protein
MFNLLNTIEKNFNKIKNPNEKSFFIFGLPKAGKSTVLSALVRYIINNPNLIFRRDPINNTKGMAVFRQWNMAYADQEFPLQTPADEYVKLHIEYQKGNGEPIKRILMYEIAGEDVIKMEPTHQSHENFSLEFKKFLLQSNGIIIIASSLPIRRDEEEVVNDFIEYLLRNNIRIPICFILTKYDLIKNDYIDYIKASHDKYRGAIELLKNYKKSEVFHFSMGNIENNKIIKDESSKYISIILKWIENA